MKKAKSLIIALVAVMVMALAAICFTACGEKWPESYKFTGTLTMPTGQSADVKLELKEDLTIALAVENSGNSLAEWDGSWKQNKDGTVVITFSQADAKGGIASAMGLSFSLNTADTEAGGMGGLTVTTAINDNNVNTFKALILLNLGEAGGGYVMPLEVPMTQVVEAA